jgi:hypothetical protein
MSEPLITDWINSIAALIGVPLIIWGIIKLFIKDKAQERKLNSLEKLAFSQDEMIKKMTEQIHELSNQTAEFQYQSELMQEANSLFTRQVQLQSDRFLHEKDFKERELEIQKEKRLLEIKPYFNKRGGGSSSPSGVTLKLKNRGNTARNLVLNKIEGEFIRFVKLNPELEVDSGSDIELKGKANYTDRSKFTGLHKYSLELLFEDIDGNRYRQTIIDGKVSKPELMQTENL